ncbi:MAG TPA: CoA transferase [Amycolatopsis sp.]|nr:CoA transferase [Amycolatopsis sp.]
MPGPLEGIRVIDLTGAVAGPMATMVLADQGADVIKVEPPGGDAWRADDASVVWHRGKRSVVLDLRQDTDRGRFRELVASADVLVESFAPGTMAKWGLDYESLRDSCPGLIYCSCTGYGREGASAGRPGYDLLVQARSGQQFEQPGWREGPIFLYLPMPSVAASYLMLEGIAAALYVREVTGRGQWVETSLYQGVLAFTTQLWQDVERPGENYHGIGRMVQPNIFECADGRWVHSMHMSGRRGKDRGPLWRLLGIEPLAVTTDPDELLRQDTIVRDAVRKFPRQQLLEECWRIDVPIAPVRSAHEALHDPLLEETGQVVDVPDPVHGTTRQAGVSFRLREAPEPAVRGGRPVVGQHTAEVLADLDRRPVLPATPARDLRHPLQGIKVLDLGNFLAGPFTPMLLADLGAEVYKLESPQGDQMRYLALPFNGCQRGKLDFCADLKTPEGRDIAHRLIREVDVVHHNMRPDAAKRLGVDYETAKSLNPRIVYGHSTMWGLEGPRATWPGFDQLAQSSCGCEHELGGGDNPPVWYRFGMCDAACAFQSAVGVLLALYWREKTGQGQLVDTSIVTGGLFLNSDAWTGAAGPSTRPKLDAAQTGFGPLYRLYRTSDGWIALACLKEAHWTALTRVVPALAGDARFADGQARVDNSAALASVLESRFAEDTAANWFSRMDAAGVPVEIADEGATTRWFTDPETVAAGLVAEYQHPEYGRMRQFGHLLNFSETPGHIWGPPPVLGQHTREVLSKVGYSDAEVADLRERNVIAW